MNDGSSAELSELRRMIEAEFGAGATVEKLPPVWLQMLRVSPLSPDAPRLDFFFEDPILVFGVDGCGIAYLELGAPDDAETVLAFLREVSQFGFRTERSRWLPWRRRAVRSSDQMTVLPPSAGGKTVQEWGPW